MKGTELMQTLPQHLAYGTHVPLSLVLCLSAYVESINYLTMHAPVKLHVDCLLYVAYT